MLIRFNEISPSGSHYEIRKIDGLDIPQECTVSGPVEARCTLTRKGEGKVELHGRLQLTLELVCDRCLCSYGKEVDIDLHLLFEVDAIDSWRVKDLEYKIPDLDTILLDEPELDLDDILRQQVHLALPMKKLCSETCKGICSRCGAHRNQVSCGCPETSTESPFDVLSRLKNKA